MYTPVFTSKLQIFNTFGVLSSVKTFLTFQKVNRRLKHLGNIKSFSEMPAYSDLTTVLLF
jgi:hypothetical protein